MKKMVIITLTFLMLFSNSAFAFIDINNHWGKNFITLLADNGIINGYSDESFRPDENINVDEFLKLTLYNIGEKVPTSQGYWASGLINRAIELNVIWNGEFNGYSRPITRGEIARIIVRALKLDMPSTVDTKALISKIPDYYDILNTYKEYVLISYANNLVTGYNDGSFDCDKNATRAEAAVIITRMMKIKPIIIPNETVPKLGKNEYFVALDGNDDNDGTIERPFKTIEKARNVVSEITERPQGGITVNIRGGDYEITSTIAFHLADGGTKESPVTYRGYKDEKVRLIGGKSLKYSSFKKINEKMSAKLLTSDAKSKVLEIDLKSEGIQDYGKIVRRGFLVNDSEPTQMELFIDGERMQLGRWPNNGYTGIGETVRSGKRTKSEMSLGAVYKNVDTQTTRWKTDIQNIFVAGVLGPNYAFDYYPIGKIDTNEITLREGAIQSYYSKPFVYYENIFEEIDAPGEYYVDRENGILYLYPPKDFTKDTDIKVSQLKDTMITIDSCNYLNFINLEIGTTRGQVIRSTNATEGLLVENCTIRNTGNAGITINNTKNTKIRNNHIYDIGYTGISLGGGDYEKLISGNNIIENNHIHKIAQIERSYQTGVTLGYKSVGTLLRNNEIHDTPHTAIIIYGPEHIVEYNNIYDAVKEFHDMDAIYMNVYVYPWERGVVIRNNYIHDLGQRTFIERQMNVAGIRTDNNGNGLTVTQNVFYNIGYKDSNQIRAVCAEGTRNTITNNLFIDTAEGYDGPSSYNPDAKFDIENNSALKTAYNDFLKYSPVYGAKYPEILNFWKEHFLATKKTNVYTHNAVVSIKIPISTLNAGYDPTGYRAAPELVLAEKNYQTNKDPGFVDYNNKNFTLKTDSEIFSKIPDFKPIEFEKIGIPKNGTVGSK